MHRHRHGFFTLTNKGMGIARANFFYLATGGSSQSIANNASIRFNNTEIGSGFSWNNGETITILQDGTYQINVILSYGFINNSVEIALQVNDGYADGTFGQFIPFNIGVGQLHGSWTLPLNRSDIIRVVNTGNCFILKQAGANDERAASLSIFNV